jgi:hypothetical protein
VASYSYPQIRTQLRCLAHFPRRDRRLRARSGPLAPAVPAVYLAATSFLVRAVTNSNLELAGTSGCPRPNLVESQRVNHHFRNTGVPSTSVLPVPAFSPRTPPRSCTSPGWSIPSCSLAVVESVLCCAVTVLVESQRRHGNKILYIPATVLYILPTGHAPVSPLDLSESRTDDDETTRDGKTTRYKG